VQAAGRTKGSSIASASLPWTIERYTRRGRTQVKPTGISQESAAAGFGLHRVVYIVFDTSGAQACHVRVVCINVNFNVNAKARHSDPESINWLGDVIRKAEFFMRK